MPCGGILVTIGTPPHAKGSPVSTEYHKIQSLYKRDEKTNRFIEGQFSLPEFGYLFNNDWIWTEKVDGTSMRVIWDGEKAAIGGRTDNAQIPVPLYERMTALFLTLDRQLRLAYQFPGATPDSPVVLYGEGYGNRIQKNGSRYIANAVDFVLFDVRVGDWWLQRENVEGVAKSLGIDLVPVVGRGPLSDAIDLVRSDEFDSRWGDFPAEGIVARPAVELRTRSGHRLITKIKTRDFAS